MATAPEVLKPEADLKQHSASLEKKELASDVLASIGAAQVQARYAMALKQPRDWNVVRRKVLNDCERPFFADAALYRKPIGSSSVTGLSIRFAEAAQRAMGNIMPERLIIFDDVSKRIVRLAITDLEANVTHYKDIILEKTIERREKKGRNVLGQRLNSKGEVVYIVEATEDDLLTKEAAISSKIERQLTLKILPADIQEEALDVIRETQRQRDKADPQAAKNRVIDAFDDLGVRVADLKEFLGTDSLDSIQPKDLADLRAIYTAIHEGETNWREVMDARRAARGQKTEGDKPSASSAAAKAKEAAKTAAAGVSNKDKEPSESDPSQGARDAEKSSETSAQEAGRATSAAADTKPSTQTQAKSEQQGGDENW